MFNSKKGSVFLLTISIILFVLIVYGIWNRSHYTTALGLIASVLLIISEVTVKKKRKD